MKPLYATIWLLVLLLPGQSFGQNPYYDHGSYPAPGSTGSSAGMRAELDLIEAGFAKLPTLSGNASKVVIINGSGNALTSTHGPLRSGTTLPLSPTSNDLFILTTDASTPACTEGAGATITLCRYNGSAWAPLTGGGGTAQGLDANFDIENEINGATSANPFRVTDGTRGIEAFGDPTLGSVIRAYPLSDTAWRCWTDLKCILRDEEAGANMWEIDPDAASRNLMYQFGANYKMVASFLLPLEPRGAATSASESIVSNQPKQWFLTVTDANTDAADFAVPVTAKMAGATTATFRLLGVSKAASPSGNIDLDCAMSSYTPGTDTFAAHVTTGEVTALLTPATQNRPVAVTTAAHTINGGALVTGDILFGSCEVDATATTSAQMSDFRLWGYVLVQLLVNSWSD